MCLNSALACACGTRTRYACTVFTCDTHAHTHIHLRTRTRIVQTHVKSTVGGPGAGCCARSVRVSVLNGAGAERMAHSAVFHEV